MLIGMKLISRSPRLTPAELAELERERLRLDDERRRLAAKFQHDQDVADRATRRQAKRDREREEKKRRKERAKAKAQRRANLRRLAVTARTVGPLLIVNTATVGGQVVYGYSQSPAEWPTPVRAATAVVYAVSVESIALYVGWHAHDALLAKAYATAARLRRASYSIAGVVAALMYSHFSEGWEPTALAVGLGMLSLLSPWLWGLHTRRAQHVQLIREDLVDETGTVFDPARRRAFPIRSWQARRWSIDHNERDPRRAWEGYNRERNAKRLKPTRVELVDESDPGIRECRRLTQLLAGARDRLTVGAKRWALTDRAGSRIEPMVNLGAIRVPAHLAAQIEQRPAIKPTAPTTPVVAGPTAGPTTTVAIAATKRPAVVTKTTTKPTTKRGRKPAAKGTEAERTATAYANLLAALDRPPTGSELAAEAGVSKSYANAWKLNNAAVK
jgi:hypothetical protein